MVQKSTAEFIHDADERLKNAFATTRGIDNIVVALIDGSRAFAQAAGQESREYSASYLVVKYIESNMDAAKTFTDIIEGVNDDVDNIENSGLLLNLNHQ